jgi:hypothetical protein
MSSDPGIVASDAPLGAFSQIRAHDPNCLLGRSVMDLRARAGADTRPVKRLVEARRAVQRASPSRRTSMRRAAGDATIS